MSPDVNSAHAEVYADFTALGEGSDLTEVASVLRDRVIYSDTRRFLCNAKHCAGASASVTGFSLEGHRVTPITQADVAWWKAHPGLGPLTCECKRLTVGPGGQIEEGSS